MSPTQKYRSPANQLDHPLFNLLQPGHSWPSEGSAFLVISQFESSHNTQLPHSFCSPESDVQNRLDKTLEISPPETDPFKTRCGYLVFLSTFSWKWVFFYQFNYRGLICTLVVPPPRQTVYSHSPSHEGYRRFARKSI
jgi:hypothetical protein